MWIAVLLLACRPAEEPSSKGRKADTTSDGSTGSTSSGSSTTPSTDSETGGSSDTGTDTAWWVDTAGDSGTATSSTTYNPYPYYPYTKTDSVLDSGFFLDSGVVGCEGDPQVGPPVLPSTRDDALDDEPYDPSNDLDGDGVLAADDCDDADPMVYPGAAERCDGVDTDCDPLTGEEGLVTVDAVDTFTSWRDAATASAPGSTLVMCPGTHEGPVWMRHDVAMIGLEGPEVTVLTAGGSNRNLLRVQQGNLQLKGLTLREADVDGVFVGRWGRWPFWPRGAAISLGECGSLVAHDVVIEANSHYGRAGAIGSLGAPVHLYDSVLRGNHAEDHGGIDTKGDLILERVSIEDHTSDDDDATVLVEGLLDALDLSLVGNIGVGLYAHGDESIVRGLYAADNVVASFSNTPGGLYLDSDVVELSDCLVENNESLDGAGGAYLRGGECTVDSCIFRGNLGVEGGGLELGCDATLIDVSVVDNEAELGGGVYARNPVIAVDSVVEGNLADVGGGVSVYGGEWYGGVIQGNVARLGGGMALGVSTVVGVEVVGNEATELGGGLHAERSQAWVEGVTLADNTAPLGSGAGVADLGVAGLIGFECAFDDNQSFAGAASGVEWDLSAVPWFICGGRECSELPVPDVGFERQRMVEVADVSTLAAGSEHVVVVADDGTWTFRRDGDDWLQTEVVVASEPLAAATDGDLLVLGRSRAVEVWRWTGADWSLEATLDDPLATSNFGDSVATDGETVLVADRNWQVGLVSSGGVHVFEQVGGLWTSVDVLTNPGPGSLNFGSSVSVNGDYLAVGADGYDVPGGPFDGGVLHYQRIGGAWTKLRAHESPVEGELGNSVAIGADGSMIAGLWYGAGSFQAWDPAGAAHDLFVDSARFDIFGFTDLAMGDGLFVIGDGETNDMASRNGAVYVFGDPDAEPFRIFDPERRPDVQFGEHVAIQGRSIFASDVDGVWVLEPDAVDPAW